jgi:diguanylate cyclase (GGDEF)-like protein
VTRATPSRTEGDDPNEVRIRRTWRLLLGTLATLIGVLAWRLAVDGGPLFDVLAVVLAMGAGGAAILHRRASQALAFERRAEVESFARILRGLSRSVSPDAIVEAIVEDLAHGTGADHIVVVRRRDEAKALEATLVSRRPGVRNSTTLFPLSDLEDPGSGGGHEERPAVAVPIGDPVAALATTGASVATAARGILNRAIPGAGANPDQRTRPGLPGASGLAPAARDRITERIAGRVRSAYGLKHTIAAPLRGDRGVIGAIVISRRTAGPWPPAAARILSGAADEASAALARAFSHRDAETRAATDALTGLPNRRYFDEFLGLLARRRRAEDAVGVLMIDIDRFKALNDTYGHGTGDEVLRAVAGAIAATVRGDDVPARFGGEEFAVLLRNPTAAMAVEIGERVREAVGHLDLRRFGVPGVSVSVGVAVGGPPDRPIGELIEDADRALYEAKRRGRDRVVAA